MDEFLKSLERLGQTEWPTKWGYSVFAITLLLLSITLITTFSKIFKIPNDISFAFIVLVQLILLCLWIKKRYFWKKNNKLIILFAVKIEKESKKYYKEIIKAFNRQLDSSGFTKEISVITFPSDKYFSSKDSAEQFIKKENIPLLIWGDTTEATVGNGDPISNFNFRFSYQYIPSNDIDFASDINIGVQRKSWSVQSLNSFPYLTIVSGNIYEISLYILGSCLNTFEKTDYLLKALSSIKELNKKLEGRIQDSNFPNLTFTKKKTTELLHTLHKKLCIHFGFIKKIKNIDTAIYHGEEAIKLRKNDYDTHLWVAYCKWKKNDKDGAKFHTKKVFEINPGNQSALFNEAFFLMYESKYELGLSQYKKIKDSRDTNIVDIIDFIETEYETTRKPGLLFSLGWINVKFADTIRGKNQLNDFLFEVNEKEEYKSLILETKALLAQ